MWIERTPEEIVKWQKSAEKEARSHGQLIGGGVWVLVSIFAASGWYFFLSGGFGVVAQKDVTGNFWLRLPIFVLVSAPFAYWVFRHESRKELAKIERRTICPKCDTASNSNAGSSCKCGGSFVPSKTMKWVE
jgi:hypothetical protein